MYDAIYVDNGKNVVLESDNKFNPFVSYFYFVRQSNNYLECVRLGLKKEKETRTQYFRCDSFDNYKYNLNGKWGLIGLTECCFDNIEWSSHCILLKINDNSVLFKYFYVFKIDGDYGVISREGEELLPVEFSKIEIYGE